MLIANRKFDEIMLKHFEYMFHGMNPSKLYHRIIEQTSHNLNDNNKKRNKMSRDSKHDYDINIAYLILSNST